MKIIITLFSLIAGAAAYGQGTFVYDQQSSEIQKGTSVFVIQSTQPIGQSFTPALSQVGFIRLYLGDTTFNNIGATLHVNLRSGSMTGPILGSTDRVGIPDGRVGLTDFFFPDAININPGTTYFFEAIVDSGDYWAIVGDRHYNYTGGTLYGFGQPDPFYDLWFREGIIVPEPSSKVLFSLALAAWAWLHRKKDSGSVFYRAPQ